MVSIGQQANTPMNIKQLPSCSSQQAHHLHTDTNETNTIEHLSNTLWRVDYKAKLKHCIKSVSSAVFIHPPPALVAFI